MLRTLWRMIEHAIGRLVSLGVTLFVLLLLVSFIDRAWGHLGYLLADEPPLVTRLEQTLGWRADQPFHARLPLDWAHAVHYLDLHANYTLVPVTGSGGRVVAILPGHMTRAALGDAPELNGRLIGPDLFGDWDAGELDTSVPLQEEMRRVGVVAPNDALLMVPGWRFGFDAWWQTLVGVGLMLLLLLAVLVFFLSSDDDEDDAAGGKEKAT